MIDNEYNLALAKTRLAEAESLLNEWEHALAVGRDKMNAQIAQQRAEITRAQERLREITADALRDVGRLSGEVIRAKLCVASEKDYVALLQEILEKGFDA